MGHEHDKWSDEHTKIVIENWSKLSAGLIARMCPGHSRNAVIGKAHRLGLPAKTTAPKGPREPRRVRVPHSGRYGHSRLLPPSSGNEAIELSIEPQLFAVGKTLMELDEHDCRWPMQNLFCGAPIEGRTSYCLYHLRGAFDVQRRKSKASPTAGETSEASRRATP